MKPRVAIITPCLMHGGTEVQVLLHARALMDHYEVTVVCLFEYAPTMVRSYRDEGIDVLLLSETGQRPQGILAQVRFLRIHLVRVIRQLNPAVIHTQFVSPGMLVLLVLRLSGFTQLVTSANSPRLKCLFDFIPWVTSHFLTKVFLCGSEYLESAYFKGPAVVFDQHQYLSGRKHFTLYPCIDTGEIMAGPEISHAREAKQPKLLCASRLSYEKGVDILIKAMPLIIREFPDTRLDIFGDGRERPFLESLVTEHELDAHVTFYGTLPRKEVLDRYPDADIIVVPSREEGFGLTAAEAMASRKVVIASATGGLKDLLGNGSCGLFFEVGDTDTLAALVVRVLRNKDLAEKISQSAMQRIATEFSFNIYKTKMLTLYRLLIEEAKNE